MRIILSIIFSLLVLTLAFCAVVAFLSKRKSGKAVAGLVASLIFPVVGNLLIIASPYEALSMTGCYIYFVGMNLVMLALIGFTHFYCHLKWPKFIFITLCVLLAADAIQLLVNIGTHHAFTMTLIENVYGADYWKFNPLLWQNIHRVLDYSILAGVMVVFIVKAIRSPRVYAERYFVILLPMIAVAAWQTFYILSATPVDFSMIGFGVFGILIFLLSIYYRPIRLLDRMLANIASRMPEALFFFDTNHKCIWANDGALKLLNITSDDFDHVPELLMKKFGRRDKYLTDWADTVTIGDGEEMRSYDIEKQTVRDDRKHLVGIYLSIRDNTEDQRIIQKESYNATHDGLTGIYNRAGFDHIMEQMDLNKCFLLLIDLDSFKEANDKYGHKVGDSVLINVANTLKMHFREEDFVCRIGGDEFAVIIPSIDSGIIKSLYGRIAIVNNELLNDEDGLPPITLSAGGAYGKDAENDYELFNNADHALYEVKFKGKRGFALFNKR